MKSQTNDKSISYTSSKMMLPVYLWVSEASNPTDQRCVQVYFEPWQHITPLNIWNKVNEIVENPEKPAVTSVDIYHNGKLIRDFVNVLLRIRPLHMIHAVVQREEIQQDTNENKGSNPLNESKINKTALALRNAMFNASFESTVKKLSEPDMLENLFAIVPSLKNDPIGIKIVQDLGMIIQLSDATVLEKVASDRPWLIDAFEHIAATVQQNQGARLPRNLAQMFRSSGIMDASMNSMEEDEEPGTSSNQNSVRQITREQLAAALNSLTTFGSSMQQDRNHPTSSGASYSHSSVGNFMNMYGGSSNSNLLASPQSLQSNVDSRNEIRSPATPSPSSSSSNFFSSNMVAQALREAMNTSSTGNFSSSPQGQAGPLPSSSLAVGTHSNASSGTERSNAHTQVSSDEEFKDQLRKMREMGITDERLAIMALKLSEGDVSTAVELIFSGWKGEGAEPM